MTIIMVIMVGWRPFTLWERTILEAARQRIRAGAGIRHEEFWQELEGRNQGKRQTGPRRKTA